MSSHRLTVFVASSDSQLLRLIKYHLELDGFAVLSASDGLQAIEQIELHTPDLVLLGRVMPKLDSFQVCQSVREIFPCPDHLYYHLRKTPGEGACIRTWSRWLSHHAF